MYINNLRKDKNSKFEVEFYTACTLLLNHQKFNEKKRKPKLVKSVTLHYVFPLSFAVIKHRNCGNL